MTVAELRKALEGVPDDLVVLISYDGGTHQWVDAARIAHTRGSFYTPDHPTGEDAWPAGTPYFLIGDDAD